MEGSSAVSVFLQSFFIAFGNEITTNILMGVYDAVILIRDYSAIYFKLSRPRHPY